MRRRAWRPALAGLAALGACACASPQGRGPAPTAPAVAAADPALAAAAPEPRVVVRQVKAACVPRDLPHAPRYPDSDRALKDAGGAADRYQLLAAGRLLRERRLELLEHVVAGCR
jgi:hypothetical protein